MTTTEASNKKNQGTVHFNLYSDIKQLPSKPKFKIGDKSTKKQIQKKSVW